MQQEILTIFCLIRWIANWQIVHHFLKAVDSKSSFEIGKPINRNFKQSMSNANNMSYERPT